MLALLRGVLLAVGTWPLPVAPAAVPCLPAVPARARNTLPIHRPSAGLAGAVLDMSAVPSSLADALGDSQGIWAPAITFLCTLLLQAAFYMATLLQEMCSWPQPLITLMALLPRWVWPWHAPAVVGALVPVGLSILSRILHWWLAPCVHACL